MQLNDSVATLKGVGEAVEQKLNKLGLQTIEDLLFNVPRTYHDYSNIQDIADIEPGPVTLRVTIETVKGHYGRRGLHLTEAVAADKTGKVSVIWFNQPYRAESLDTKAIYFLSGDYQFKRQRFQILNPTLEKVSDFPKNTARIVPVYPQVAGLKSTVLRNLVYQAFGAIDQVKESLPAAIRKQFELIDLATALRQVHFPSSTKQLNMARERLAFDEIFPLVLTSLMAKADRAQDTALAITFNEQLAKEFVASLPFTMTPAQKRAAWEILQDMNGTSPMNRLLQGDVGSGKTVVAAMAAFLAAKQGIQVALLAPTEILVSQHYQTLQQLLEPSGLKLGQLTSATKAADRKQLLEQLKNGTIDIAVGTHALLQKDVDFQKLGLLIVDEQHRFGVKQRQQLRSQMHGVPHFLSMSATPIPRSLALTLYGDLEVSIIDELPPGRKPVKTAIYTESKRSQVYEAIEEQITQGRQAFVVCPLIEESTALKLKNVTDEYQKLDQQVFKRHNVGLLHGRMKADEKQQVMADFASGKINILVSTTVIEVGVNVPNANIVLVEGAERFGLAQIHQLRGRVRRAEHPSYCYLIPSTSTESARLQALEVTDNGFKLAELDLKLRGPGEVYGRRQHGVLDLRIAKLSDTKLINRARQAAETFLSSGEKLIQYPRLKQLSERLQTITYLD